MDFKIIWSKIIWSTLGKIQDVQGSFRSLGLSSKEFIMPVMYKADSVREQGCHEA